VTNPAGEPTGATGLPARELLGLGLALVLGGASVVGGLGLLVLAVLGLLVAGVGTSLDRFVGGCRASA